MQTLMQGNRWWFHLFAVLLIAYGAWFRYFSHGIIYTDAFHDGEFVASLPAVLAYGHPFLTIHGGMDWVLSLLAYSLMGAERHFVLTMFLHYGLNMAAAVILYRIFHLILEGWVRDSGWPLLALAMLSPLLVDMRDVFLLMAIWLYLEHRKAMAARYLPELLLGMVLALNMFWSFDRGLVGLAGFGLMFAAGWWAGRPCLRAILAFLATLTILSLTDWLHMRDYADNLLFLIDTSSQWSYGYSRSLPVVLTLLAGVANGWVVYRLVRTLPAAMRQSRWQAVELLTFLVLTLLMFKIGINRADSTHVVMALWMPALTCLFLCRYYAIDISRKVVTLLAVCVALIIMRSSVNGPFLLSIPILLLVPQVRKLLAPSGSVVYRYAALVLAALLLATHVGEVRKTAVQEAPFSIEALIRPPLNEMLVKEDVRWVVAEFRRERASCLFDLSNSGVINGLAELVSCTRFTYPVYATRKYEAEMLAALKAASPPVVVYSSTEGAFAIDGRSMHDRLPEVAVYLAANYPFEKCEGNFCLRYRSDPEG